MIRRRYLRTKIITKKTYSENTGAVTGGGEADLDDAPDILDPPAAEVLRDPPESDSDGYISHNSPGDNTRKYLLSQSGISSHVWIFFIIIYTIYIIIADLLSLLCIPAVTGDEMPYYFIIK